MVRRTPVLNENWFQQWAKLAASTSNEQQWAKLADGALSKTGSTAQGEYDPYWFEYFVICRLRDTFEGEFRSFDY